MAIEHMIGDELDSREYKSVNKMLFYLKLYGALDDLLFGFSVVQYKHLQMFTRFPAISFENPAQHSINPGL